MAHGLCQFHYDRQRRPGLIKPAKVPQLPLGATPEERFWSKVKKTKTCWLWLAGTNDGGYGQIRIDGRTLKAHVFAYELLVGPVPKNHELDHCCRNKVCVRPTLGHVRASLHKGNMENVDANIGSASGVRGVYPLPSGRWRAMVSHNKRNYHLGCFDTVDEAAAVAKTKRLELFTHNELDRKAV